MENGQLELAAPEKRRTFATLEQKLAIADMLRQRLRKNTYGLYRYENGWDDAAIAAAVSATLPTVSELNVRSIRTELFGSMRLSSEAAAQIRAQMKAKQAEAAKRREAQSSGGGSEKALAAVLKRLEAIEARLDHGGFSLPQDAKK